MYKEKRRGRYISKKALIEQFDPSNFPSETHLLCELQWGETGRPWTHWIKNDDDDCHAEIYFLGQIFEMRRSDVNCHITLYLSWSPCANCSDGILDFLKRHWNVTIDIYVARLYCINAARNRTGLRGLASSEQVNLYVMRMPDYNYCWKTFIRKGADDFWPGRFQPKIKKNCARLRGILKDLYS